MAMDRSILKHVLIQCYIVVSLLMSSCSYSDLNSKYGVAYNQVRQNVGLPVLDSTWRYNEAVGVVGGSWINPICPKGTPCHFKKCFLCENDGTMLWEEDIYIGSNKYTTVDGTFEEMLRITYYFKDNRWGYLWTTGVSVKNSRWEHEQDEEISSKEADSLLTLWGII